MIELYLLVSFFRDWLVLNLRSRKPKVFFFFFVNSTAYSLSRYFLIRKYICEDAIAIGLHPDSTGHWHEKKNFWKRYIQSSTECRILQKRHCLKHPNKYACNQQKYLWTVSVACQSSLVSELYQSDNLPTLVNLSILCISPQLYQTPVISVCGVHAEHLIAGTAFFTITNTHCFWHLQLSSKGFSVHRIILVAIVDICSNIDGVGKFTKI
jgi:hypothetical protein